jgi:hypothetical protein
VVAIVSAEIMEEGPSGLSSLDDGFDYYPDGRVFSRKERPPGCSEVMRRVFEVLYDNERPMSRTEIVREVAAQLGEVEVAFLYRLKIVRRDLVVGKGSVKETAAGLPRGRKRRQQHLIDESRAEAAVRVVLVPALSNYAKGGSLATDNNPNAAERLYWLTAKPPRFRIRGRYIPFTPEVMIAERKRDAAIALKSAIVHDRLSWEWKISQLDARGVEELLARLAARRLGPKFRVRGDNYRGKQKQESLLPIPDSWVSSFVDLSRPRQRAILRVLLDRLDELEEMPDGEGESATQPPDPSGPGSVLPTEEAS